MELFVNELSLHGQFDNRNAFQPALKEMLACRNCAQEFSRPFYVLRSIRERPTIGNHTFRDAVHQIGNINITRLVMRWIDQNGPFLDDTYTRSPDDYYECEDEVVTDSAIGEVAARSFADQPASLVSFCGSSFERNPINVDWCRTDNDRVPRAIDNHWFAHDLKAYLEVSQEAPTTWSDLLAQVRVHFSHLTFADNLHEYLQGEPFSSAVAKRVFELLSVLDQLKVSFDDQGHRTPKGEALVDNYFRRKNARFTDASETEKQDSTFRNAMTFTTDTGERIECFWHGKITTHVFRIHFSYPIEPDAPLYIAYIGPKLTKK